MVFIHANGDEKMKPLIGKPICAVLQDGSYYYGILGGIKNGSLILNRPVKGKRALSADVAKAKLQLSRMHTKAKTSGFGFPGFGSGGLGGLGGFGGGVSQFGGLGRLGGLLGGGGLRLPLGILSFLFGFPFLGTGFFI